MSVPASMTPLTDDSGRRFYVRCPQCGEMRVAWLRVMTPEQAQQWRATRGLVDHTAALLPPAQRADAMRQSAEAEHMGMVAAWISCVTCGYDDALVHGQDHTYVDASEDPS
jgi:phage terminase large subunit GpA-like protein